MGKMDEQILVVKRPVLFEQESLAFQGLETSKETVAKINSNLGENIEIMRRGDAEEDPTYKQPIPYALIKRGEDIFLYERLQGGGEARLHNKLSIGVGGHMNKLTEGNFHQELFENLNRELEEELEIKGDGEIVLDTIGLINDDENEVGCVHLGLLVVINLTENHEVTVREVDQLRGEWVRVEELSQEPMFSRLESWSQIAVEVLNK